MRELIASHKDLAARIEHLEANQDQQASVINLLAEEIVNLKQLPPEPPRQRIGFAVDDHGGISGISRMPKVQTSNLNRGLTNLTPVIIGLPEQ